MQNVTYYEWPESQDCLECNNSEQTSNGDFGCICRLNYDRSQDKGDCHYKEPKSMEDLK